MGEDPGLGWIETWCFTYPYLRKLARGYIHESRLGLYNATTHFPSLVILRPGGIIACSHQFSLFFVKKIKKFDTETATAGFIFLFFTLLLSVFGGLANQEGEMIRMVFIERVGSSILSLSYLCITQVKHGLAGRIALG